MGKVRGRVRRPTPGSGISRSACACRSPNCECVLNGHPLCTTGWTLCLGDPLDCAGARGFRTVLRRDFGPPPDDILYCCYWLRFSLASLLFYRRFALCSLIGTRHTKSLLLDHLRRFPFPVTIIGLPIHRKRILFTPS